MAVSSALTTVAGRPFAIEAGYICLFFSAFALLIHGVTIVTVAIGAAGLAILAAVQIQQKSGPPKVSGYPFVGSTDFFSRRYDFLTENAAKFGSIFEFNLLQHRVFCLTGTENRLSFFNNHAQLNFQEGYKVLFGGVPIVEQKFTDEKVEHMSHFNKRLTALVGKKERMAGGLPVLIQDVQRMMAAWGDSGVIDPFVDVYKLVFHLTSRMIACHEIVEDEAKLQRLTELYWDLEGGSAVLPVLFPWFPSPAKKRHEAASREMFTDIITIVEQRRASERKDHDDALQFLIDSGDSNMDIVQFIMGGLFAGIINTGINSAWLLLQMAHKPIWRERIEQELRQLITKFNHNDDASHPIGNMHEELGRLPLDAWENHMPVLEKCLREVLRMTVSGGALRRVMRPGYVVEGYEIPVGSFITVSLGGAHLSEKTFKNPYEFDPERFDEPRAEDKNGEAFSFLGWGAGRHPCLGIRFAKLEMKIICAMALATYSFATSDAQGNLKPMNTLPQPNRNNIHTQKPVKPVYLRYTRVNN
ncbi:cytochrome P450 [Phlyctochytrium arcticum]|nr:cytochrome P450 [Phlyctochytrium arcticum]